MDRSTFRSGAWVHMTTRGWALALTLTLGIPSFFPPDAHAQEKRKTNRDVVITALPPAPSGSAMQVEVGAVKTPMKYERARPRAESKLAAAGGGDPIISVREVPRVFLKPITPKKAPQTKQPGTLRKGPRGSGETGKT